MASLAQSLVSRERERLQNNPKYRKIFNLGIDELDTLLEYNVFSHHTIRRHPENISSSLPIPLDETSFNEALDEFATAEMRFGK
ncbi:hypothetical protein H0H81_011217 [Sphagnurus paluster]|uniref:Uncharacterized protein n=1 Tax=Sphagnurus paluster TaxID=117069 RepID=A0A9P7G0M2_9AGAR|nr:hypothetical protein H0H81_011217 [Sphagnurus paluster]